ncbi:hypothetical protein [Tunturiibacter gelidiferens]|uniref:hypothetical protein n=1 Tax=Tunturiibacter gelidiferens TaxID=3069689 RepID=UPI003D9B4F75
MTSNTTSLKSKRGRKPSDLADFIGKTFGRLTVIRRAPRKSATDRNPQVEVVCSCPKKKTKVVRTQDLRDGKIVGCGCRGTETFNDFQDRQARKLDPRACRQIFTDAYRFPKQDPKVAKRNNVHPYVIRAVVRLHQARLIRKFKGLFTSSKYGNAPSRQGTGLLLAEFRFLRAHFFRFLVNSGSRYDRWALKSEFREVTTEDEDEGLVLEWDDLDEDFRANTLRWSPGAAELLAA